MWPFYKNKPKSHDFDDNDRQLSLESRRLRREMENAKAEMALEKQKFELEKLKVELDMQRAEYAEMMRSDEEEDTGEASPESMLMGILASSFMNKQQPVQQTAVSAAPVTDLTDEQIKQIIAQFKPSQVSMFKKMPRETQINLIRAQMPGISDNTINRALELL